MNKRSKIQNKASVKSTSKKSRKSDSLQNLTRYLPPKKSNDKRSLKSKQFCRLEEVEQLSSASFAKARKLFEQMTLRARSLQKLKGRVTITVNS